MLHSMHYGHCKIMKCILLPVCQLCHAAVLGAHTSGKHWMWSHVILPSTANLFSLYDTVYWWLGTWPNTVHMQIVWIIPLCETRVNCISWWQAVSITCVFLIAVFCFGTLINTKCKCIPWQRHHLVMCHLYHVCVPLHLCTQTCAQAHMHMHAHAGQAFAQRWPLTNTTPYLPPHWVGGNI